MKTTELNGHKVQVKRGTIETLGNEVPSPDSSTIAGLTFTDGEAIRRTVLVESSIVAYVAPGTTGTFVFADGPAGRTFVIAVDVEGRGLRVANPAPFGRVLTQNIVPIIFVLAFTGFSILAAVMMPFLAVFVLIPAGIALKGIFAFTGLSKIISIIKTMDRTRQVPIVPAASRVLATA